MDYRNIKDLQHYKNFPVKSDNFKILNDYKTSHFEYETELNIILNLFSEFERERVVLYVRVFPKHVIFSRDIKLKDFFIFYFKDIVLINDVVYFINSEDERKIVQIKMRQAKIKSVFSES
jgi:hypothetical protein